MPQGFESMMKTDFRRLFTTSTLYIMLGIALIMPVLILCMTTAMGGTDVVDPTTGAATVMDGFTNAWYIIAKPSDAGMSMDITAMCNINLIYFMMGVFLCLFISENFTSGYVKNLFANRAKKGSYIS